MSDDLVERVGRELARTGYAFAGIDLTDPYTADADYWNSQARSAIAVALEEAAKIAEAKADEWATVWRNRMKADSHMEGKSDGADEIATAIRALILKETA